jgi:hypothetical protein
MPTPEPYTTAQLASITQVHRECASCPEQRLIATVHARDRELERLRTGMLALEFPITPEALGALITGPALYEMPLPAPTRTAWSGSAAGWPEFAREMLALPVRLEVFANNMVALGLDPDKMRSHALTTMITSGLSFTAALDHTEREAALGLHYALTPGEAKAAAPTGAAHEPDTCPECIDYARAQANP